MAGVAGEDSRIVGRDWRLPQPRGREHPSLFHPLLAIQLQQADGRPSVRGIAAESPIGAELEVICPNLSAGLEQRGDLPGLGIYSRQVAALVPIAEGAAEGEVGGIGRSSVLLGDDVVDLVRGKAEPLRHPAIFAVALGALPDQPPQGGRDRGGAHD